MINTLDYGSISESITSISDFGYVFDSINTQKNYGFISGKDGSIMAFNIQNAVVDRVLRVSGFDLTTGENIFTADDIQNPSWENTEETATKTNALGAIVATFGRAKGSTFSAETTYLDFGVLAAQLGTSVETATESVTIASPKFEIITVGYSAGTTPNTTIALAETPITAPNFIYLLNSDKTKQLAIPKGSAASATEFAISGKDITLPTTTGALLGTDMVAVWYNYETENAVKVVNGAENFPEVMNVQVEVLFADKCNQNTKYHGFIVYPKARPDGNFSFAPTTDGTHSFGFTAQMDACSAINELCSIIVPQ